MQPEINQYSNDLDSFLDQLERIKKNEDTIDAKRAYQLKQKASNLYAQWHVIKQDGNSRAVAIGGHELPPLTYPYDALEPYINRRIMKLHHDKHHKSYVEGLNKAEKEMEKARRRNDYGLIKHWEREAAFNGAGHYLHTIFWNIMHPHGGGKPKGELLSEIERWFGSFEQFKQHFSEAAKQVEAVGWAILVWAPRSHRPEILQAEKHQNLSQWDVIPLLVLDVWEHAYYLQYENNRGNYVDNWWNVVNWGEVEKRYNSAKKVKWNPY
ncbi:superoxide dismutase [Alkalihalobacillus sp. AL-G]|nr:superoxide dismutase [Alkalihalobacillus sp. AL-G]WLD95402.1 superoxide dismutase [Alkalihalobacillus sp. AL-G]